MNSVSNDKVEQKSFLIRAFESEQTKRVAKTACYILMATEGPLAVYTAKIGQIIEIGCNIKDRKWTLLAKNSIILVIDCVSHPIFMIIRDGWQIGEYSILLYEQARERDLHALLTIVNIGVTTLSLVSRVMPSPELIVITAVIKISMDVGRAVNAFRKGEIIEGVGFVAAAGARGYSNVDHFSFIYRKWEILNNKKYQKVLQRIEEGKDTDFLKGHPMEELRKAIEEGSEIYIVDDKGNKVNLGANFSDLGEGMVKDMVLTGRVHQLKEGQRIVVNFKLTKVYRERVQKVIDEYKGHDKAELAEFLQYYGVAKRLSVTKDSYKMILKGEWKQVYSAYKAENLLFENLGRVQFGGDAHVNGLYKNVTAVVSGDAGAKDLHMLLALSGMGRAMHPSSASDILRLKLGTLYRTFYPSKGIKLQRTEAFFDMPVAQLQEHIIKQEPGMKAVIAERLPKMQQKTIRKGWTQWSVPGLAEDAKKAGGAFLTHTVTGASGWGTSMKDMDNVATMLETGMASTNKRFENGLDLTGMSSYADMQTGGSDSVFTRIYTQSALQEARDHPSMLSGELYGTMICISLDSVERGTYQSHHDSYGAKGNNSYYMNHDNVVSFAQKQNHQHTYSNEVMLNQVVLPSEIRAIIVTNEAKKTYLVNALEAKGLLEMRNGRKIYKGSNTAVDDLIYTKDDALKGFERAAA